MWSVATPSLAATMQYQTRYFELSLLLLRDSDGWSGVALQFGIATAGRSPEHTLAMLVEAVGMTIGDDLMAGRQPAARVADEADWADEWAAYQNARTKGEKIRLDDERAASARFVAIPTLLTIRFPVGAPQGAQLEAATWDAGRPDLALAT